MLSDNFARHRFLANFLEGGESWERISTAVALVMGFRPSGDTGTVDRSKVTDEWLTLTDGEPKLLGAPGTPGAEWITRLELELPEDGSEGRAHLIELVGVLYGDTLTAIAYEAEDKEFIARSNAVQWLQEYGFNNMDDSV